MSPVPPVVILTDQSPNSPHDPPPPYPSRDRRHRRRRMTVEASSADSEEATIPGSIHSHMHHAHADETTPLLGVSSPTRRPRTRSLSSVASISPSLAQTVASAFRMDLDSDAEDEGPPTDDTPPDDVPINSPGIARRRAPRGRCAKLRHYFRPMGRRVYWSALLHLLVLNFPYALFAWLYLFVFTLVSTIL
jgi:hypothetical protein